MMVHFYVFIKVERGLTVKKLLSFILSIFLIVILSESVSATSSTTYQIPDAKFRLDIPMDYYVVTKDSASSELITEFGYTQDDFQGMLESANCSLYAFNKDFDKELVLTLSKEENSNEQSQEPKPSSLSHSEPTQSQSESIQTQAELAQSQPDPPQTQLTPAQPHLEISQSESQSVQPRDEINFCWKCGAKVPQESNFCPKCGHKLQ